MSDKNACILEVVTDGKSRTIALDDKVVTFGRSRKNTVPLRDDAKVSAEHCQVVRQKESWMLIDCGSKNKTFLNGSAVSVSALKHGDSFKIGETAVTFRVGVPTAMDPKEAEKLMTKQPSANEKAGEAIAAALATPVPAPVAASAPAPEHRAPKKSSGVRPAVRVERGSKGVSAFAIACFFVAGLLSGVTALSVMDNRDDKKPAKPAAAKIEQPGPEIPVTDPKTAAVDPAPKGELVAVAPKEEPKKEEPVAVAPKEEPKKEEPVAVAPKPVDPPVVAPKETPVVAKKDPVPPPPVASEDPPVADDPVSVKPVDPKPTPPGDGGTSVEPPDDPTRPPTQFMGLKTMLKRVVFVMDVTGSMEDPATVTPAEFSGPPEIKIGAELKRQLEKFNRKDVKTKLDAAKYELTHSIAYLHADVEFTVIFYSFSPTPWQKRLVAASDKNKIDAIKRIKTTSAWGGTNIFDALDSAFGIIDDHIKTLKKPAPAPGSAAKGRPDYAIFLVTDGRHNTGRFPDPEEFLKEIRKINKDDRALINTIGVGQPGVGVDPPDPVFLARLASENGGEGKMLK